MQVENEYGSYGNDKRYLIHLREGFIRRGIDVELFTSDGPTDLTVNLTCSIREQTLVSIMEPTIRINMSHHSQVTIMILH